MTHRPVPLSSALLPLLALFFSCNTPGPDTPAAGRSDVPAQEKPAEKDSTRYYFSANVTREPDKHIRSVFQDRAGNYWFGTNADGVYRYDGETLIRFTEKDGLSGNQVQAIQQDASGNLWFGTGGFGVSRFDGRTFKTFTTPEVLGSVGDGQWKIGRNDLWFFAGGGVYRYNGGALAYLSLAQTTGNSSAPQDPPNRLSSYGVYCCLKDRKGNLWLGTQSHGVCRFDGNTFTWFTEKGLAGPAVLGLFEDSSGNLWFGTNGSGVFRYDPATNKLVNLTDEKGLGNPNFATAGKDTPGTMARIYAFNEDKNGVIWIGTVDAGVWRYDGNRLTNYTTQHGLTGNAVNTIYKDNSGKLWFGTDSNGLCTFDGTAFSAFTVHTAAAK